MITKYVIFTVKDTSSISKYSNVSSKLDVRIVNMAKPTLYYATLSPPSRSVLLTANLIGIELNLKKVDLLALEHLKPEFVKVCHKYIKHTII